MIEKMRDKHLRTNISDRKVGGANEAIVRAVSGYLKSRGIRPLLSEVDFSVSRSFGNGLTGPKPSLDRDATLPPRLTVAECHAGKPASLAGHAACSVAGSTLPA